MQFFYSFSGSARLKNQHSSLHSFFGLHSCSAKRLSALTFIDSDDSSRLTGSTTGDSSMHRCEKCQGTMLLDREVDMESGMSLLVLWCINCGLRKQAERAPIPLIEV
ncbi:MAG TPA: hypothetical protein DD706_20960 [Nitrospiraceae bacterium]|nr:hypothetical protein [Nitrospiraceae bacterium]